MRAKKREGEYGFVEMDRADLWQAQSELTSMNGSWNAAAEVGCKAKGVGPTNLVGPLRPILRLLLAGDCEGIRSTSLLR
jgi:hypothetical protein